MKLRNAAGEVVFDSRYKTLGVQVFYVTAAQAQNIILNGAVINLTLSSPMPGAFVSSPLWISHASGNLTNQSITCVKITQPNSTTIRLSRQIIGPSGSVHGDFQTYSDSILMVARNA